MSSSSVPHQCAWVHPYSLCKLSLHFQLQPKVPTEPSSMADLVKQREILPEKHKAVMSVIKSILQRWCHGACWCLPILMWTVHLCQGGESGSSRQCSERAESRRKISPFPLHSLRGAKQKIPMPKRFISSCFIASLRAVSFWTCCNPICSC